MNQHAPSNAASQAAVEVFNVEPATPHSLAVYEAGKALLLESVQSGRDFCRFMITTSLAGIPVYLGLLTYLFGQGAHPKAIYLLPALLFLLGTLTFTMGLLPRIEVMSLDVVSDIESTIGRIVSHRRRYIRYGLTAFIAATVSSTLALFL